MSPLDKIIQEYRENIAPLTESTADIEAFITQAYLSGVEAAEKEIHEILAFTDWQNDWGTGINKIVEVFKSLKNNPRE